MIDVNEIAQKAYTTALKRFKSGNCKTNPHDTIAMLKHCVEEVIEVTEAYINWQLCDGDCSTQIYADEKFDFAIELMDVVVCALITAHYNGIDVEKVLNDCMVKNVKRV